MLQQWPFSQSALLWMTFLEDATAMFQLWCSVNWGLRPRLFRVVSAATCPAAALHVNLCPKPRWHQVVLDVLPMVPHIIVTQDSMGPGVLKFLQLGLRLRYFSEMSQQPGASCSSPRHFHLGGVRDVSKVQFQLRLFAEAMFQQPSNKFVFQVRWLTTNTRSCRG